MNFRNLPLPALHVLSDAIGRLDYEAADLEAARVEIRNAVATAILHHEASAHLAATDEAARLAREAETVTRVVTMEDLGPEAQAVARHALEVGADRVTISTAGTHYWYGGTELRRPDETYQQWGARIERRN
jgi:hypothetical protein